MPQPRKPPPTPVTEPLKAERIQQMLRDYPEWRVASIQLAGGARHLHLTDDRTVRGLTKKQLELAAALQKVA